jgi:ABC-type transport system involved in multi-copper enzyme maturation permease subunit
MVWKEVYAEPGLRLHWIGRIIVFLLVVGSFVPVIYFLDDYFNYVSGWRSSSADLLAEKMSLWGRIGGAMVGTLLLVGVAVRAAGAITGERDKQTLDSLLTSPLDSNAILIGKWLGSVLSMRRGWIWLGAMYFLTLACGGMNLVAPFLLAAAWLIFASVVALLGLWFSTICRSTMKATVLTLLMMTLMGVGHWLLWLCCLPLLWTSRMSGNGLQHIFEFQAFALTPPVTLGELAFRAQELDSTRSSWNPAENFAMAIIGMFIWTAASFVLWGVVSNRLRHVTMRAGRIEPEESMPRPRRRRVLHESDSEILTVEQVREEE